jgi:hypothetical protein
LRRRLVLATATAFAVVAAPAVAAERPFYLDTYAPKRNAKHVGPVATKNPLTAGKPYVVSVRGTWSYLDVTREQLCGAPERRPLFPSRVKGVKNRRVIADAEFYFAQRPPACTDPLKIVQRGVRFQIRTRSRFYNPVSLETNLTAPTANHSYSYPVKGFGRLARFRIAAETFLLDNYGRLRIRVRPATAADCTALGAAVFGFADVPSCVAATALPETVAKPRRGAKRRAARA